IKNHITYLLKETSEGIEITAIGVAAHASTPEAGHNAICGLVNLLADLPLDTGVGYWKAIAEMFPDDDFYGEALKVNMEDEISGKLTMNLGILNYDGNE
ncbi:peptidase dimerization domain-containing protein, partial [Lacrimispora saccharolytica]|nr:peptidase dimerization domain-containing protein [Lacrimispora saccharolytica]